MLYWSITVRLLAGLKMGSLLCLPRGLEQITKKLIDKYNHMYNQKGLHFRILYACPKRTLLYVYRPAMVASYVQNQAVMAFLTQYGYAAGDVLEHMLDHLADRFREGGCFPHESGIFLGYPLEDVCGFITPKGEPRQNLRRLEGLRRCRQSVPYIPNVQLLPGRLHKQICRWDNVRITHRSIRRNL